MHRVTDELTNYWRESARPLASLILVAPLLACYEWSLWWRPEVPRTPTEHWLRAGLGWLGTGEQAMLPFVACGLLLAAHHRSRRPWHLRWNLLPTMICESLLGGMFLLALLQGLIVATALLRVPGVAPSLSITVGETSASNLAFTQTLSFIGTGVYEELFFRAMMITPIAWLLQRLGETRKMSFFAAAVVSSLLFALSHYQALDQAGESFYWFTFVFRVLAGGLFAALYVFRGLGITAGAHVAYDILIASTARA